MTMQAAVVERFKQPLQVRELPVPKPGHGQVLVKIETSGLCHTDIHAAHGDWPVKPSLPFVPGHEGVGLVARVGADVTRLQEGDRVAVPWLGDPVLTGALHRVHGGRRLRRVRPHRSRFCGEGSRRRGPA